ncbi:Endonuclease 4 [Anatilimnocola aggregata]|uniref:Probable endonuclease 4 n=1 Tax=Anatilimnocola aggregata TaxID=2528021 RepID=A0A517YIR0_9BACT|nr:deoxyribonuclease IV [Anatilimnocola aggregata]QDU30117.1 Endonuclease 4 [Anatilimnocola aggregata]
MPLLGAHMSIAGGYYKALDAAGALGMETCQVFTKNNNQWRAKEITKAEIGQFADSRQKHNIQHVLSHASYLINMAAEADELWNKSVEGLVVELQRAAALSIPHVVVHPGAGVKLTEEAAIARVSAAINRVHDLAGEVGSQILLENTAGQGTTLGRRFEQLAAIIAGVKLEHRVGVCIDTCHAFAAGYPLGTLPAYTAMWNEFDTLLGRDRLKAMHLNDSKKPLGSRVDRHEHIGHGALGLEPFRLLMNDVRLQQTPMYLETEKAENDDGEPWDAVNLRTLRELVTG